MADLAVFFAGWLVAATLIDAGTVRGWTVYTLKEERKGLGVWSFVGFAYGLFVLLLALVSP